MLRTDVRLLKVARQGIEPRLTDSKSVVHPSHSQASYYSFKCPSQESNLVLDLRKVACASGTLHGLDDLKSGISNLKFEI